MSTTGIDLPHKHGGDAGHGHGDHGHEGMDPHFQHHFTTMEQQADTTKIGMWLFLATEVLLFGGLFVGFGLMQQRYPREFVEAHEHLVRWQGALNTVVLLFSSFTMVMAVDAAKNNKRSKTVGYLFVTIICACIFLVVKYFEYTHKFEEGWYPAKYYRGVGDAIPGQPWLRDVLCLLLHDDRAARHPHRGGNRTAELDSDAREKGRIFECVLHPGRPGGLVLAHRRHDLDLPVPALLFNPVKARRLIQ